MRNVLITGDAGYIGQHLKKMLVHNINDIIVHSFDIANKTGDVREESSFARFKGIKFHTVIHLAALVRVGESVEKATEYYKTNVIGTSNVFNNVDFSNFIFASTGAVVEHISPYGYSKYFAEKIVRSISGGRGTDYTIFRFYNVIGQDGFDPTNPDGLFYNLKNALVTNSINIYGDDYKTKDGTCVREYIHVNDVCRAIIKAIDKPANQTENLAYGDPRTVKEIVQEFLEVNEINCEVQYLPRRKGDVESSYLTEPSTYMERHYSYKDMLTI
jgi:UDP-glucose 4-epimerase